MMWKFQLISIRFLVALLLTSQTYAIANAKVDLSDVGQVALENSGSPEAQQSFLHGLAQLHNFEYRFAAQDFQEAQRLDPDFVLAYWGEAMTHNHPIWMRQDREAARAALAKLGQTPQERLAKTKTDLARDLLSAVEGLYGEGTKEERDDLYRLVMADLHTKYPENVDVAAFYALSIMGTAHEGREFDLYMQSAALMQNFIRDYPQHPGVAHYLIHATDDPTHAPLGLIAANAYGDIAPNAGHAQHMTTHIFLALGDWDGVIRNNIRASKITDDFLATRDIGPSGCGHYTSWLMYGYLQQGKRDEAHAIMELCFKNASETERNSTLYYYAWQRALYLLDTDEWDGDVAAMKPDFAEFNAARHINATVDGWVNVKTGDLSGARAALKEAREAHKKMMAYWEAEGVADDQPDRQQPVVRELQLEGMIAQASGNKRKALKLLREAVEVETVLPFGFGPPQPAKPSLELLGEALNSFEEFEEAKDVLNQALARTPNKRRVVKALKDAEAGFAAKAD